MKQSTVKILGIGESIIDRVYMVEHLSVNSKTLPAMQPDEHVGGPVLAALIVLSRLGLDCTLVSSIGRDDEAKVIKKTLKHEGIKFLHKIQRHTKINTILVEKETGQRQKIRGDIVHPDIKNLDRKFIRQFDAIVVDRHEKTAYKEILEKKRPDTKIVIDPSIEVSPTTVEMVRTADYPIIPIESLTKIGTDTLHSSLQKLHEISQKPIIVTAGEQGCILFDGHSINLIPAYDVHAVDVTGAGDVYRGAFAYGIIRGWDLIKSATFGNFVAGLQCTKVGNIAAIPTKTEMQIFELMYQRKPMSIPSINDAFNQTLSI